MAEALAFIMKKILILGGCGFLGKNITEELLNDRRYSLIVFDRPAALKAATRYKGVLYYAGDFNSHASLEKVFKENKVDTVLHLVSTTVPAASDGFGMVFDIESNLVPTVRLLCMMREYGAKKIIFASSGGSVYGPAAGNTRRRNIPESAPTNPICSHGTVKLAIEKYISLSSYLHGLQYLILRISNPYGEHHSSSVQGLINVALKRALNNEPVTLWGNGEIIRDYIYVKDCARIFKTLMDKGLTGETLNIGSGTGHSVTEVLGMIKDVAGEFKIDKKSKRKFDVPRSVLDISKLRSLIDFNPTGIREGITNTYSWLLRIKRT